ncbi:MAG: GH1 family beta-glucosidase [Flavobacteriales bacterium]
MSPSESFKRSDFGSSFVWGVSSSAWQTEGSWNPEGRGDSVWDTFARSRKKLRTAALHATDFYHRYKEDLDLMQQLNIPNFRFSVSWPRVFPHGTGNLNSKGIAFYDRLVDACLERNIEPWITLYHWDLPQELENKGGWRNRDIVAWFEYYTAFVCKHLGDRVKKWIVLNEPMAFAGAGYLLGYHAPAKRSLRGFYKVVHHINLVQGCMPSVIRQHVKNAEVGTSYSYSHLEPFSQIEKHIRAVERVDQILNRLFIEALEGKGYPDSDLIIFKRLNDLIQGSDLELMKGEYDFIGLQNYTREIISHAWYIPWLKAMRVSPRKREVENTLMNWEVYPPGIYHSLKRMAEYPFVKKIYITENGASFNDQIQNGRIDDANRQRFFGQYLAHVLKAKNEGVPVEGYFIWTFTDNLEWAEGYVPRFGLVHVDFKSQERTIKESGYWYSRFLNEEPVHPFNNQYNHVYSRANT